MNRRAFLQGLGMSAGMGLGVSALSRVVWAADAPPPGERFCFCVLSDPHCSEGPAKGLEAMGSGLDRFFLALRTIEAMDAGDKPDFVLVLGDLHVDALETRLSEIALPLHVIAGNHESSPETRKKLRTLFPKDFSRDGKACDYYSFVHKGARFIGVCDAGMGGEHVGQLCSENIEPEGQCEWIEEELRSPEPVKVLFAHIPLERNGEDHNMYLSRNDSRWLRKTVEETPPSAMFFGHLHHPTEEYAIGPARVFQVRSCSWNFNRVPIGFLHVTVEANALKVKEIITGTYS